MKAQEAIETRQSIREFSNKPVKFDAVMEAVDAANHAPFAGNINNLKFILVSEEEKKQLLAENAQQYWIADASWIIIVCSEQQKLEELYDERGKNYSKQQAGAAIENILLRLTELGIGSCWIGAFADNAVKAHFKIPDKWEIEALITVGYPKNKMRKPTRKTALENKIFWEKWDEKKKPIKKTMHHPTLKCGV
ncbi:MAG: Nitroreductase [Parcubacteria group bacterium GW2011_GWA1_36_12]|nr:MAG: Nitroreductase [Parcubacteria group bacterium GW2011_GWA1_36_12]